MILKILKKYWRYFTIYRFNLLPTPPKIIYLIINNACNLYCKMCDVGQQNHHSQFYQTMIRKGRQLSLERLKKLVDEVRAFKPIIAITSTEPLLFKNLFPFIHYAKSAGLAVHLTTNGFLLPNFAREIVLAKVDILYVSLDGPENIHNEIRGHEKSYQNAVSGINLVSQANKELKGKTRIGINYTISNHNYFCLFDFLNDISHLRLHNVTFSHMNYVTAEMAAKHNERYRSYCPATESSISNADPLAVDVGVLTQQLSMCQKRKWPFKTEFIPDLNKKELETYYRHPEHAVGLNACLAPFQMAQIASDGELVVTTRCFLISMGNIFESDFRSIWFGEKYKSFRKWIIKNGLTPACMRCCGTLN